MLTHATFLLYNSVCLLCAIIEFCEICKEALTLSHSIYQLLEQPLKWYLLTCRCVPVLNTCCLKWEIKGFHFKTVLLVMYLNHQVPSLRDLK